MGLIIIVTVACTILFWALMSGSVFTPKKSEYAGAAGLSFLVAILLWLAMTAAYPWEYEAVKKATYNLQEVHLPSTGENLGYVVYANDAPTVQYSEDGVATIKSYNGSFEAYEVKAGAEQARLEVYEYVVANKSWLSRQLGGRAALPRDKYIIYTPQTEIKHIKYNF